MKNKISTAISLIFTLVPGMTFGGSHHEALPSQVISKAAKAAAEDDGKKNRCKQAWEKYRESQACFAPYILVNGGVKAEAFKHCTEVKQPEFCE